MILHATSNRWPTEARSEEDPWRREGTCGEHHPISLNHRVALAAGDLNADHATPTDNETIDCCVMTKINRLEINVGRSGPHPSPPA